MNPRGCRRKVFGDHRCGDVDGPLCTMCREWRREAPTVPLRPLTMRELVEPDDDTSDDVGGDAGSVR